MSHGAGFLETAAITGGQRQQECAVGQAQKDGKKIIVCTIQAFALAVQAVQDLAATGGKRFAVVAGEAHSSQTGSSSSNC